MRRDYAAEHQRRRLLSAEHRAARADERARRNADLISAGELAWSTNNEKLRKLGIVSFGIPAGVAADGFNTCPAKGICAGYCYARQGFYVWPHVAAAHERNLAIVRAGLPRFIELAVRDLGVRRRPQFVRVHDSGDFFSAAYLKAWLAVARRLPEIRFYTYTKMFWQLRDAFALAPPNFRVIQSFGGVDDGRIHMGRPHARVFVTHEEREAAGYVDGTQTDEPALRGAVRIGLVYHSGGKKLTDGQVSALRVVPDAPQEEGSVPKPKDGEVDVTENVREAWLSDATPHGATATVPMRRGRGRPAAPWRPSGPVAAPLEAPARGSPTPEPESAPADPEPVASSPQHEPARAADGEREDGLSREVPAGPRYVTVTVALNEQQAALLDNLVSVGLFGASPEAAAHYLIARGLAHHFPKAFAGLGFRP